MAELRRVTCPVCERSIPVGPGGILRPHVREEGGDRCPAEGMKVGHARKQVAKGKLK